MISFNFGSSNEWMVPESVYFSAEIENTSTTHDLWPLTPNAGCLFERMEVRLGGQLIEQVTEYNRVNELFTRITMDPMKKLNQAFYGFRTENPLTNATQNYFASGNHVADKIDALSAAHPDRSKRRIHWKANLSGLLSQHLWIPFAP